MLVRYPSMPLIIKRDLRALLRHIDVLEKSAVSAVGLLLNSSSKLEKILRHRLSSLLEDINQPTHNASV